MYVSAVKYLSQKLSSLVKNQDETGITPGVLENEIWRSYLPQQPNDDLAKARILLSLRDGVYGHGEMAKARAFLAYRDRK